MRRELEHAGWTVEMTGGGHFKGTHPEASAPLFFPSTPSDARSEKNTRAQAARLLRKEDEHVSAVEEVQAPEFYVYQTSGVVSQCIVKDDPDGVRCVWPGCEWRKASVSGAHFHELSHTDPERIKTAGRKGGAVTREHAHLKAVPVPTPEELQARYVREALQIIANALDIKLQDDEKIAAMETEIQTLKTKIALISETIAL